MYYQPCCGGSSSTLDTYLVLTWVGLSSWLNVDQRCSRAGWLYLACFNHRGRSIRVGIIFGVDKDLWSTIYRPGLPVEIFFLRHRVYLSESASFTANAAASCSSTHSRCVSCFQLGLMVKLTRCWIPIDVLWPYLACFNHRYSER